TRAGSVVLVGWWRLGGPRLSGRATERARLSDGGSTCSPNLASDRLHVVLGKHIDAHSAAVPRWASWSTGDAVARVGLRRHRSRCYPLRVLRRPGHPAAVIGAVAGVPAPPGQ